MNLIIIEKQKREKTQKLSFEVFEMEIQYSHGGSKHMWSQIVRKVAKLVLRLKTNRRNLSSIKVKQAVTKAKENTS